MQSSISRITVVFHKDKILNIHILRQKLNTESELGDFFPWLQEIKRQVWYKLKDWTTAKTETIGYMSSVFSDSCFYSLYVLIEQSQCVHLATLRSH